MGSKQSSGLESTEKEYIKSKTHYSGHEIRKYYERFMNEYPSGKITHDEFVMSYSEGNPNRTKDATIYADHLFKGYDQDGNGEIDFREFMVTMAIGANGTPREKLEWAFNMYDSNGDNELSIQEIIAIIIATQRFMGEQIDEEEAEEAAYTIFSHLDINRDRNVTKQEFVEGALQSEMLMERLLK